MFVALKQKGFVLMSGSIYFQLRLTLKKLYIKRFESLCKISIQIINKIKQNVFFFKKLIIKIKKKYKMGVF